MFRHLTNVNFGRKYFRCLTIPGVSIFIVSGADLGGSALFVYMTLKFHLMMFICNRIAALHLKV